MKSSELSQTSNIPPATPAGEKQWLSDSAGMTSATGQITRVISRRRSHRRQWRLFEGLVLLILDATLVDAAFRLAYNLRYQVLFKSPVVDTIRRFLTDNSPSPENHVRFDTLNLMQLGIVIGALLIFSVRGLYRIRLTGTWFRQIWIIASSATIGIALLITYYFVFQPTANSRLLVPFVWAVGIVMLCLGRLVASIVMGMLYQLGFGETRLLVVGSGRLGKMIMQHIAANPSLGYSIVGFLHDMENSPSDFGRFKMLGTLDDLSIAIRSMQIDEVIIALPSNLHQQVIRTVRLCERLGTSFKLVPDLYELSLSRIDMEAVEGIPLIGIKQFSLNRWQSLMTRIMDITIAGLILLLGSPLWLCIALAVRLNSTGEAIYKQARVGLNGKLFQIYKFRTMYKNADQVLADLMARNEAQGPLFKMRSDPRVTAMGRLLRKTSLDEIPQFINVLKGEMSLVGPRPALPREVALYEEWQRGRLAIKPGISGLWQVRGRSDLSFDEGVLLDLYYIENWSLRLYFQILLRTIPVVVFRQGAY